MTARRVSRATCQVGSAELSANGSSNCQASAGRVSQAFGLDHERLVLGPEVPRGQLGVAGLVVRRVGEADREGLDRPARRLLHQADDDRRVDAAGEERPERDVGDHLLADGVGQGRAELLDVVLDRPAAARGSSPGSSSGRS